MVAVPCLLIGAGASAALSSHAAARTTNGAVAAATEGDSPPSRTVVVAGPTTAHLADDDRAALRALIRDELAASAAKNAAPAAAGAGANAALTASREPETERPLSSEDLKVYDRVRTTVDEGVARGNWTEDDRAHVHDAIRSLPPERASELVRPLFVALNEGKLHFEGRGPLF
jgi:hypothetical protein